MADLKITQLSSASIATGSNVLPIVQGGVTEQITVTNLAQGIFNLNLPLTASGLLIGGNLTITGSLSATAGLTGSLLGTASYALNGGVTQLLAGPNVTLSPTNGLGQVTITAALSGSTSFNTATGSYGSFYDTTTQTNPVGNVPRSMSLNTTDITNGVSISGSTNPYNTYIKTENAGIYNIQFSAQVEKTDSGTDVITIWLRKNGIDLTDSATKLTLSGNGTKVVAAWNWFVSSAANDYYQIIWVSADTGMRLYSEPINDTPGIPSVILTVNRVDQFLSNTGSFSGSFTGSLLGTASLATTSSYAINHAVITSSYVCDGILNANQTFATGSDATIAFVDYIDPNGWLASNQFKPTIAGYYSVSFGVWLQNPGVSTNQVNTQMRKNGNSIIISQQPLNNGTGIGLGGSRIVQMNGTTDYLDWTIFQGTAGSGTTGTILQGSANGQGTWFSAFLLTQ
jgi:hypothetical protein